MYAYNSYYGSSSPISSNYTYHSQHSQQLQQQQHQQAAQVAAAPAATVSSSQQLGGGQIQVMTWNPPFTAFPTQHPMQQHPTQQHHSTQQQQQQQQQAHHYQREHKPAHTIYQHHQQQHVPPPPPPPTSVLPPMPPPTQPFKLTTSFWEDEGTVCFQVDARGTSVARRQDNDMVNGTKLLNVVGMSRGKRDGILKNEPGRVVVKVGAMHLKGVWITISRAKLLAKQYKISELLHPLFVDDPAMYFYMAPPPPILPPGYMFPFQPPQFAEPSVSPQHHPPQHQHEHQHHQHQHQHQHQQQDRRSIISHRSSIASVPSVPSMLPEQPVFNYDSHTANGGGNGGGVLAAPLHHPYAATVEETSPQQAFFPRGAYTFDMDMQSANHSLLDYASRAGGSSSGLSGITNASDSAPNTPQQYYHQASHLYDDTPQPSHILQGYPIYNKQQESNW